MLRGKTGILMSLRIVAWAGVGKSTLVNHWLGRMAAEDYRSAQLVFGWSFYRQGSSGGTSSADEFLDAALTWFGDPDPQIGSAWEKGERLAKLISHRRTLLVLDGLEPLQNPPGQHEGRLRDPSLQALLRELAAFNSGLCLITTRLPIADVADHEQTSVPRRDLEQLSSDAGAKLLRALGVRGDEAELRSASDEFLARYERNPAEVERLASDLIELSTAQNFAFWLACGEVSRGWARSASGDTDQGIASIDDGIRDYRATGSILITPCWLVLKSEALHLAKRTSEALAALEEAETLAQRTEERECFAELHRLRGVFLTSLGADEAQIDGAFCEAISIAREQKSISLTKRAEATYAEYRQRKGKASGLEDVDFDYPFANLPSAL